MHKTLSDQFVINTVHEPIRYAMASMQHDIMTYWPPMLFTQDRDIVYDCFQGLLINQKKTTCTQCGS